jgi:hypothetical protein
MAVVTLGIIGLELAHTTDTSVDRAIEGIDAVRIVFTVRWRDGFRVASILDGTITSAIRNSAVANVAIPDTAVAIPDTAVAVGDTAVALRHTAVLPTAVHNGAAGVSPADLTARG